MALTHSQRVPQAIPSSCGTVRPRTSQAGTFHYPLSSTYLKLIYLPIFQKLRTWFGNHTRDCVRGTDSRHVLDLSGKANRRPLPLQPAQAYSILYYAEGTPLYQEIHTLYEKYLEGDAATVAKLSPIFSKSSTSKTSASPTPEDGITTVQANTTATTTSSSDTTASPSDTTASPSDTTALPSNATLSPTHTTVSPAPSDATTPQSNTTTLQPNTTTTQMDAALHPPKGTGTKKKQPKKPKKATKKLTHPTTREVPKFVVFQQAIIREKIKEISEVEADAVETLIEERYAAAMQAWESPWTAVKASKKEASEASEVERENQFYQGYVLSRFQYHPKLIFCSNIDRLAHSVQVAIEEVRRCTTHNTFVMCGGPSPGTGDATASLNSITYARYSECFYYCLHLCRIRTGLTIEGGQDFVAFLGPMYDELENKFLQWLQLTYSTYRGSFSLFSYSRTAGSEELERRGLVPSATTPPAASPTPTPGDLAIVAPESPTSMLPVSTPPSPTPPPPTPPPVTPPPAVLTSALPMSPPLPTPPTSIPPTPPPGPTPTSPTESIPTVMVMEETESPMATEMEETESSPAITEEQTPPMSLTATQISFLAGPGPEANTLTNSGEGLPMNIRLSNSGDTVKYPKFLTLDILRHLRRASWVSDWPALVQLYLDYEVASPSKSVSLFLYLVFVLKLTGLDR